MTYSSLHVPDITALLVAEVARLFDSYYDEGHAYLVYVRAYY